MRNTQILGLGRSEESTESGGPDMVLQITPEGVVLGAKFLAYENFPAKVLSHLRHCPSTPRCEELGSRLNTLLLEGTGTDQHICPFIREVCEWGGKTGNRVRGTIQKGYNGVSITTHFTAASKALSVVRIDSPPDVLEGGLTRAIHEITEIYGLSTSYASKMLRFLRPDVAGVFDSVISGITGCDCNEINFARCSVDCTMVAHRLTAAGVVNPRTDSLLWRAGDVDQALFALCQGWSQGRRSESGTFDHHGRI